MDQILSQNPPAAAGCLGYKQVRRRKIAAAVLFAVSVAFSYFIAWFPPVFPAFPAYQAFSEYFISRGYSLSESVLLRALPLDLLFPGLLMLTAYLLLIRCAANRPCKTAVIILAANTLLNFLADAIITVTGVAIMADKGSGFLSIMFIIKEPIQLITMLGYMYAISLIIRNGGITENAKSWITMLAVFNSFSWIFMFVNLFVPFLETDYENLFFASATYSALVLIMFILMIIAYVKLAMSDAFSEKCCEPAARPYTPLNRYVAGILIATVVTVFAVWAYYSFAASHINNLF